MNSNIWLIKIAYKKDGKLVHKTYEFGLDIDYCLLDSGKISIGNHTNELAQDEFSFDEVHSIGIVRI